MNKFTWLIILILWILLGLWLCNKYICGFTGNVGTNEATSVVAPVTQAVATTKKENNDLWKYKDQNNLSKQSKTWISFTNSGFNHLSFSTGLNKILTETAEYLKSNKERALTITGFYESQEKNNSILPNLGLARANDIKAWFTSNGVPGKQLEIRGEEKVFKYMRNDTIMRGADFAFSALSNDNSRIDDIKSRLLGKPITVYFQTNSDNINLSVKQRKDISDIVYYLDQVSGSKLNIEGHTDNVGNRDYNVNLSKNRAAFVKDYFIKNGGLAQNRMNTNGFGPDKPIATNNTDEGKAKNRRVEVTLR